MKTFGRIKAACLGLAMGAALFTAKGSGWDSTSFPSLATSQSISLSYNSYTAIATDNTNVYVAVSAIGGGESDIYKWNLSAGWGSGPILHGSANDEISAMKVVGSYLYVAGSFTAVDPSGSNVTANNVARYYLPSGTWSAVGTASSGVNGHIRTLFYDPWGSGSTPFLYMGGQFTSVAGTTANNIAGWNGSSWSGLSGGVDATGANYYPGVHEIDVQHYGSTGSRIVIGGNFVKGSANDIAYYDNAGSMNTFSGAGLRGFALDTCSPCAYLPSGDVDVFCHSLKVLSSKVMLFGDFNGIGSTPYPMLPTPTPDPMCPCVIPAPSGWSAIADLSTGTISKTDHSGLSVIGHVASNGTIVYALVDNGSTICLYTINSSGTFTLLSSTAPNITPNVGEYNSKGVYFMTYNDLERWILP